ncbi:MAG: polyhydroxyalkanoate synthesis repressor PhaR [Zoogloeaceae bacterium]|nr:polyhydroxyalkanoate synthesis repressor PhaR [Zoogloeaceae bacterium]
MTKAIRLIKKYPNRRLYDTQNSVYITLGDIKRMVLDFENLRVEDAKSGDDLTRCILLQVLLEEETVGLPIFSVEVLSQMIRFYGHTLQSMLGKYLENNIRIFVEFQHKLQEQSLSLYGENPQLQGDLWAQFLQFQQPAMQNTAMQNMMSTYMDQSKLMFQQMQEQLQTQIFTGTAGPAAAGKK